MVKSGKKQFPVDTGGKWFSHPGSSEKEEKTREACTSTGFMLSQVKASLPQALHSVYYPKWRDREEGRENPFSNHDNRYAIRDNIAVFQEGLGRKKGAGDRRQHNSKLCLGQEGRDSSVERMGVSFTVYQADFMEKTAVGVPTAFRRFPHNHKEKAEKAAYAQAKEPFMGFGKYGLDPLETASVRKPTNSHLPGRQ